MEFSIYGIDRDTEGNLKKLPRPSIDTGMGLERIAAANKRKLRMAIIIKIDTFRSLIDFRKMVSVFRVCNYLQRMEIFYRAPKLFSTNIRTIVFLLADGVRASNEGRVMCTGVLFVEHCAIFMKLLIAEKDMATEVAGAERGFSALVRPTINVMEDAYPELNYQSSNNGLRKISR